MPTILCFSTVDWDYLWHRPQAVMSRFAQDGYQILYVDTLGLGSPALRDLPRIASRLRNRLRAQQDGQSIDVDSIFPNRKGISC